MKIEVLDGSALAARLREGMRRTERGRFAVAFWGEGPFARLVGETPERFEIVCNLKMGGTNPGVIRSLRDAGTLVLQSDTLHAKIYLLDQLGAVGSSNASANGLSLQNQECDGWNEANIVFERGDVYDQTAALFDRIKNAARVVSDQDLDAADEIWTARRRAGAPATPLVSTDASLLDALRLDAGRFSNHRVYIVVSGEAVNAEKQVLIEQRREATGLGNDLSAFDWPDLPSNADLFCFFMGPRGGMATDGLWHMPAVREEAAALQWCTRLNAIRGVQTFGPLSEWKEILTRARADHGGDASFSMKIEEFAKRYIGEARA